MFRFAFDVMLSVYNVMRGAGGAGVWACSDISPWAHCTRRRQGPRYERHYERKINCCQKIASDDNTCSDHTESASTVSWLNCRLLPLPFQFQVRCLGSTSLNITKMISDKLLRCYPLLQSESVTYKELYQHHIGVCRMKIMTAISIP